MMVDYGRPIETVNGTPARVMGNSAYGSTPVQIGGAGPHWLYDNDGAHLGRVAADIRNVAELARPVRTAAEMLDRMEALVRRMEMGADSILAEYDAELTGLGQAYAEARAIVAEMTPPVDPDLTIVDGLVAEWQRGDDTHDGIILRAIKRGRELERQGK